MKNIKNKTNKQTNYKKTTKLLQNEMKKKKKTPKYCRRSSQLVKCSNADHLISLWTHVYWLVIKGEMKL